ncbi:MAG: biopolymer transporter ExbD [Phycisphaerales bacterium]
MRRRRPNTEGAGHPNLTPMIDVVMCLIVFYLLVGQLASDQRSDLSLPRSATGDEAQESQAAFVNVRLDGDRLALDVDGAAVPIDQLGRAVRAAPSVHLRADAIMPYERLSPVLAALRQAGVRSVRVATEQATIAPFSGGS